MNSSNTLPALASADEQLRERSKQALNLTVSIVDQPTEVDLHTAVRIFGHIRDRTIYPTVTYVRKVIETGEGILIFAKIEDQVVGAALLSRDVGQETLMFDDPRTRHIVRLLQSRYRTIHLLAVDPEHRHLGVGSALESHAVDVAIARGARYLTVIVEDDTPAVAFFRERGYDILQAGKPLLIHNAYGPSVEMPIELPERWGMRLLKRS